MPSTILHRHNLRRENLTARNGLVRAAQTVYKRLARPTPSACRAIAGMTQPTSKADAGTTQPASKVLGSAISPAYNAPVRAARQIYNPFARTAQMTCVLAMAALLVPLGASAQQAFLLPRAQLDINNVAIQAEVAATEASRSYGLMNRMSLPENQGMLFVFEKVAAPCFWMKNTPLPLSIAFIDPKGIISNIADMQPLSLDAHCPTAPVLYALEMEQGWFARHGIKAGDRVKNLP